MNSSQYHSDNKQAEPVLGKRPHLVTLMMAASISALAINMFVPSMPGLVGAFDSNYATVQLGLSLYLGMTAILQLLIGPLSDKFGRRPVLIGGFIVFLIGTLITLFASSIEVFLLGRLVQASSATGMVLSRVIVRDLVSRERAASYIGYVTMGMAVAPMLGPAIGGFLDEAFGWQASFVLLLVLGFIATIAVFINLPETNKTLGAPISKQFAAYRSMAGHSEFWLYVGTSATASAVFFGFLGGGPAIASETLKLTPSAYGIWFSACAVGYMIGNFLSGKFSEHYGIATMMKCGAVATLFGAVLPFVFFSLGHASAIGLFGPMFLVGIGNGMTLPSATAGAISIRPDAAGAASGLLGASQIGLGAILSVLCGAVVMNGQNPIGFAAVIAACGIISLVISLAAAKREKAGRATSIA